MNDLNYSPVKVKDILAESPRLKYVLMDKYLIHPREIFSLRIDSDNYKIDVRTADLNLRFKAKGTDSVLMQNPESGVMTMVFDPALAQGIYTICSETFYALA